MENNICLIIPYFGTLPNYFDLWVLSASYNSKIDFLIITDNEERKNIPSNIKWIKSDLRTIKKHAAKLVDFEISLDKPYKLCDFRPAYGLIFKEYISKYGWWGFCDLDVILGDLSIYIDDDKLKKYDKILELGPLTTIRNNEKMNNLWKIDSLHCWSYKEAYKYDQSFHFDEGGGLSYISYYNKVKTYSEIPGEMNFSDINPFLKGFKLAYLQDSSYGYIFLWKNGKLSGYTVNEETNKIEIKEFTYLHLQKRKMIIDGEISNMSDNGFFNYTK